MKAKSILAILFFFVLAIVCTVADDEDFASQSVLQMEDNITNGLILLQRNIKIAGCSFILGDLKRMEDKIAIYKQKGSRDKSAIFEKELQERWKEFHRYCSKQAMQYEEEQFPPAKKDVPRENPPVKQETQKIDPPKQEQPQNDPAEQYNDTEISNEEYQEIPSNTTQEKPLLQNEIPRDTIQSNYTYQSLEDSAYNFDRFFAGHRVFSANVQYVSADINEDDFDDSSFDNLEFGIQAGHKLAIGNNFTLEIGFRYQHFEIAFDEFNPGQLNLEADSDDEFVAADLPLIFTFMLTDRLLIRATAIGGFYSDYNSFDAADFTVNSALEIGFLVLPSLYVEAGVALYDDFNEFELIPLVGFIWKPEDEFDITVKFPLHARINYLVRPDTKVFLFYELERYQFRLDAENNLGIGIDNNDEFVYLTYQVGLGVEYFISPGMSIVGQVGSTIYGELDFDDDEDADSEIDGAGLFAKITFVVNSKIFDLE